MFEYSKMMIIESIGLLEKEGYSNVQVIDKYPLFKCGIPAHVQNKLEFLATKDDKIVRGVLCKKYFSDITLEIY